MTNNIYNSVTSMMEDMDLNRHWQGEIVEIDADTQEVRVTAKTDRDKHIVISVHMETDVGLVIFLDSRHGVSPMFAQMVLENLAIQIDPTYYDDE